MAQIPANVPMMGSEADNKVVRAIIASRTEALDARLERMAKNRRNREVFFGRQDFSHKQEGQSAEFLPKVPNSVEQMSAFVKRGLVQFGDWFSIDVDRTLSSAIDGSQIRSIIKCFLDNLWVRNNQTTNFPLILSDVVKCGLLESLMILKVHGGMMPKRTFKVERGKDKETKLITEESEEWRLRVDLVQPEDYYPDPSGNGLYEIHRVERDLHEILSMAEEDGSGVYDMEAVKQLIGIDYAKPEDEARQPRDKNQLETTQPSYRKRVVLDEFWGTILDDDGTILHRNVVSTLANGKFLIRKPEPNPFWHQESPFIVAPLIRVPWSVWHKALYDHAAELNLAINEMFNLILDGGLAAVWGTRQIRLEELEDPSQVSNGLAQGVTLAVKSTLPPGAKAVETVTTGNVPQDALAIFEFLNREYAAAALTNELKLGSLPAKQVRATEVVEASQSQAITLDGVVADLESGFIRRFLHLSWMTILQNADDIPEEALVGLVDRQVAVLLARASPEERFAMFAGKTRFRVHGLSGTMAKAQDFQKLMAALQAIMLNPVLAQEFMLKYSADKVIAMIMRFLNIDVGAIQKDEEELAQTAEQMQQLRATQGLMNGKGEGSTGASAPGAKLNGGAPLGGGSELPAQVNQLVHPQTGLTPNA